MKQLEPCTTCFKCSVLDIIVVNYCCAVSSTVFKLDTSTIQLDSCTVCLDTAREQLDSPATMVATGHHCRLCTDADAYSNGAAGWDGVRRPAPQPAAAREIWRRYAEGHTGACWGRQWLAYDQALNVDWRPLICCTSSSVYVSVWLHHWCDHVHRLRSIAELRISLYTDSQLRFSYGI